MSAIVDYVVFFFKQKTAYEMLRSLVGSEMCIRDRPGAAQKYVLRIEELVQCPIRFVSVGPEREALIDLSLIHI